MILHEDPILEGALHYVGTLSAEKKPILKCLGRTLAEDIVAKENLPPFDYALRDGFALNSHMTHGAAKNNPKYLSIIGEVCAGKVFKGVVRQDGAVNIMTGAPIPAGTDCVIPLEAVTKEGGNLLIITDEAYSGMNIRIEGSDVASGSIVLKWGTVISPLEIGVLVSLGKKNVEIIRRPEVSIVATGDEVVSLGRKKDKGQLFNSNALCIASMVASYGGIPRIFDVVPDDRRKLQDSIFKSFESDLLITIGGTSRGLKDFVSQGHHGLEEISLKKISGYRKVPLRILKATDNRLLPHLALPGKPVGCAIAFEIYGRPVIDRMSGRKRTAVRFCCATMQNEIVNEGKANLYARVKLQKKQEGYLAWATGIPEHDIIYSNVEANGFALVSNTVERVYAGDQVNVFIPGWSNI